MKRLAAASLLATFLLGCQVPVGARPSEVVVWGEGGRSSGEFFGEARDYRGGASVSFEILYEEDASR